MRHRDRRTVTAVVKHEAEAVAISRRIARGGIVHAGRQELGTIFEVKGEIHALHRRRYAALLEQRETNRRSAGGLSHRSTELMLPISNR